MINQHECPLNQKGNVEVDIKHLEKKVLCVEVGRAKTLQSERPELESSK